MRTARLFLYCWGLLALPVVGAAQPGAPTETDAAPPTAAPPPTATAGESVDLACPPGNLLAGKRPHRAVGVTAPVRLTDNVVAEEGAEWRTNLTAVMADSASEVVYDLGTPTAIRAVALQGDNNDTYEVSVSADGDAWATLWVAPRHPNPGMRLRTKVGLSGVGRYVRVSNPRGDEAFSLGELQVFCSEPSVWPPPFEVQKAAPTSKVSRAHQIARWKMAAGGMGLIALLLFIAYGHRPTPGVLAGAATLAALALLFASYTTRSEARDGSWQRLVWVGALTFLLVAAIAVGQRWRAGGDWRRSMERMALLAVMASAVGGWTNFGTFHGSRVVHFWDTFHYFMGSKYFKETRYNLLYHCSLIAEVEDGRGAEIEKRQIRHLGDNRLGPAKEMMHDRAPCMAAFTPERWEAFQQDLRLFRSNMGSEWWGKMFKDHGYNATPVWTMAGQFLTNRDWRDHLPPADLVNSSVNLKGKSAAQRKAISERFKEDRARFEVKVERLAMVDALMYLGIFLLIGWAFGLRAAALAMVIWGTGYPWAYFWTGGGFGRVPWLFMATAGMCLLKKDKPLAAGFALTWSALLRGFPAALVAGVALKIGWDLVKHRRLVTSHRKFIAGCALSLVVLVPASIPANGGLGAYQEFLSNTSKHKATPLTNHMGLPTLLSWHPEYISKKTKDDKLDDPFFVWKEKRRSTLASRQWLHISILGGFALLLIAAGRFMKDWELTAASVVMAIGVFELTCYYYNFVVLLAPFALQRLRHTIVIGAMAIVTQIVHLEVGWYDEQYTAETVVVLAVVLYLIADRVVEHLRGERAAVESASKPAPAAA